MKLETNGGSHHVQAEVLRGAVLPFDEEDSLSMMRETLARYTMEGATGHGISEYLERDQRRRARRE
jgi:hypothetical protein